MRQSRINVDRLQKKKRKKFPEYCGNERKKKRIPKRSKEKKKKSIFSLFPLLFALFLPDKQNLNSSRHEYIYIYKKKREKKIRKDNSELTIERLKKMTKE